MDPLSGIDAERVRLRHRRGALVAVPAGGVLAFILAGLAASLVRGGAPLWFAVFALATTTLVTWALRWGALEWRGAHEPDPLPPPL